MSEQIKVLEKPEIDVLRTVRDNFASKKWRWMQNSSWDGGTGFCLSGAINHAAWRRYYGDPTCDMSYIVAKEAQKRVIAIIGNSIPWWNDRVERRLPSVLEVLDNAIGQEVIT